jgi:hypothetical protein
VLWPQSNTQAGKGAVRLSKLRAPRPAPLLHRPAWGKTSTPDSTHKRAYNGVQAIGYRQRFKTTNGNRTDEVLRRHSCAFCAGIPSEMPICAGPVRNWVSGYGSEDSRIEAVAPLRSHRSPGTWQENAVNIRNRDENGCDSRTLTRRRPEPQDSGRHDDSGSPRNLRRLFARTRKTVRK